MADFRGYLAAREAVTRVGPWLLWPAAVLAWAAALGSLFGRSRSALDRVFGRWAVRGTVSLLTACLAILIWYHWRINRLLPIELTSDAADFINRSLDSMGPAAGYLPPVDPAAPPRYLIPFWIEGEKFYFWTFILGLVALAAERVAHWGYRFILRLMLALHVLGTVLFDNPLIRPLEQFHREILPWFTDEAARNPGVFFKLYGKMIGYYNASYMWLHPPSLFIAYATLGGTFAASLFTLRRADPELERSAYVWARIGYILLTLGMLVGYPWAIVAWGPNWWWDPKIAASIMMWLLYSAYLHHRFLAPYRGGRAQTAALGILCYAALLFTYFMSWYFPGQHTF